jgi:hypothetical protein
VWTMPLSHRNSIRELYRVEDSAHMIDQNSGNEESKAGTNFTLLLSTLYRRTHIIQFQEVLPTNRPAWYSSIFKKSNNMSAWFDIWSQFHHFFFAQASFVVVLPIQPHDADFHPLGILTSSHLGGQSWLIDSLWNTLGATLDNL